MITKIGLSETGSFPKLFIDYIQQNKSLRSFYGEFPDLEGFKNQIAKRKFEPRDTLVEVLVEQYKHLNVIPENVNLLKAENTFCVTTGHQLNIFTGPLYVIYKIISTINLANKLKEAFPEQNFVPVYWMATEDHDFAEINHFNLFGQKHHWNTNQTGAVGRMDPKEISEILEALKDKPEIFENAYLTEKNLADAVRNYMHALFGEYGLVCIDGDNPQLKSLFKKIMIDDVEHQTTENIVGKTSESLENLGYKTQINARNINLFYLENDIRERIDFVDNKFEVNNTKISLDKNQLLDLIENEPQKLSPNVVLRPLYQECVLPNLAYLGGPSEVAYWLQLKDIFEYHNLLFPIVMPRNFGLIINQNYSKKIQKLGLTSQQLFEEDSILKKKYVAQISSNNLELAEEIAKINTIFDQISQKAMLVDQSLKDAVAVEKSKNQKNIENLEKRIKKAEERNFETALLQVVNLKEKLFPGGGLQERHDNFLNFYINNPGIIAELMAQLDPLDFRFNIIQD